MNFAKSIMMVLLALFLSLVLAACSGSSKGGLSPVEPGTQISDVPGSFSGEVEGNRDIVAVYDAVIDPDSGTFSIEPSERSGAYHFPLTQYYPNVLKITGIGWTPVFWADIKLTHPFPGSGIVGFDPRVIAIVPANMGNAMYYPGQDVLANNKILYQPDGYTKLFDNLAPSIAGNTNPFKAYFKAMPFRAWLSYGTISDTQRWYLNLAGFGGPMKFKLVVDVSTNFPNAPQQRVDNAKEPVKIAADIGELPPGNNTTTVAVTLLDWQGPDDIFCVIECPNVIAGQVQLFYTEPGPNPNEYIFANNIMNELQAGPGEYGVLIDAWDINTDIHIYSESKIKISNYNLMDVTPSYFTFSANDISIDGMYAYVATGETGLQIFDLSDPFNPAWVKTVDTPGFAQSVTAFDRFAYVADMQGGLSIIYTEFLQAAQIVNTIEAPGLAKDVAIWGSHAYVAWDDGGLRIIDITNPESAFIMNTVEMPGYSQSVAVMDNYAYVTYWDLGLCIVDISSPETAFLVNTIDTPGYARDVSVYGNYAMVADDFAGVQVINIPTPETAFIEKTLATSSYAMGVEAVSDGHVLVAVDSNGLDIWSWELNTLEKTVDTPGNACSVKSLGETAYVSDKDSGFQVIDYIPYASAYIAKSIDLFGNVNDVQISGNYAYVADGPSGVEIINIESPESAYMEKMVSTVGEALGIYVSNGYAYVAEGDSGVQIISIEPLESAHVVATVDTPSFARDVYEYNGLAYVADGDSGLQILNVMPPESASIINAVDTPGNAWDVHVEGNYAYIADGYSGLTIINIAMPETAYIVITVPTTDQALGVKVVGDYAYVADYNAGLVIINIAPPESASIVKTVDTPHLANDVDILGGSAFVADGTSGLQIISVGPISTAHIVGSIDTPGVATRISLSNGYAYVADLTGALRIIKFM